MPCDPNLVSSAFHTVPVFPFHFKSIYVQLTVLLSYCGQTSLGYFFESIFEESHLNHCIYIYIYIYL